MAHWELFIYMVQHQGLLTTYKRAGKVGKVYFTTKLFEMMMNSGMSQYF